MGIQSPENPDDRGQWPPAIPSDLLSRFLENQAKEVELREWESAHQRQIDLNKFEYAKLVLASHERDQKGARDFLAQRQCFALIFLVIMVFGFLAFLTWALHLGKEQVALEMIKVGGALMVGGFGGFWWGKSRAGHELSMATEEADAQGA